MSKNIHTIQSSYKSEFDKEVNQFLELGCELMDGGYEVINSDDGVVYSQVIVFKNCEVEFYENGQLKFVENKNEDGKRDGLSTHWYENGQKSIERTFKDGKMDGLWTRWYENGQNKTETTFKDGKGNGLATSWHENGQKDSEGTFKNGKPNGLVTSWHANGQKRNEATFKDGELISAECWDEDGNEKECD